MTKEQLENEILSGLSSNDIANKYNVVKSTVGYWLNKHKLKTNYVKFTNGIKPKKSIIYNQYDWSEIQKFYDEEHTWQEVSDKFGICKSALYKAKKRGQFKSYRSKSDALKLSSKKFGKRILSEETKRKISVSRTAYLIANPDKVPYLINHSSKKSYPEQIFENALIASNITGWQYAFQNGIYEYDFAFIDKKIDVEIDGGTHKTEKVKKIDERRDTFSKFQGWKVIRFEASRVKKDVIGCINELKLLL